jgi:hypothetical protein
VRTFPGASRYHRFEIRYDFLVELALLFFIFIACWVYDCDSPFDSILSMSFCSLFRETLNQRPGVELPGRFGSACRSLRTCWR